MTLSTEYAVNPAILMLRDAHIIDVRGGNHVVGHGDRLLPETEIVDTVGRLGHSKEGLAVGTLDTNHKAVFALPLDGTAVQRGIHHDTLHEIGIVLLTEIVLPLQRGVLGSENRIFPFVVDTIAPLQGFVLARQQLLVVSTQRLYSFFKIAHIILFFSLFRYFVIPGFRYSDVLLFRNVFQEQRVLCLIEFLEISGTGQIGRRTEILLLVVTPQEEIADGILIHNGFQNPRPPS